MLLATDIGNTRIKAAVFEENTMLGPFVFDGEALEANLRSIYEKHPFSDVILSSVGGAAIDFEIPGNARVHLVSHKWHFPFENLYTTPQTLGIDRMVLAAGAALEYPGMDCLVIDAGTCITYDFVNAAGQYLGGAISPGLRLRYAALNSYTANLPLLETEIPAGFIGDSTAQAIHSGVVNAAVYEIEGFIDAYGLRYPNFIIILTGGDGEFFARRLKNTIFANSNFLLESLNKLFQFKNRK
jgi:type III pantothenate kinase